MNDSRWSLALLLLAVMPVALHAQKGPPRQAQIIYNDGFTIKGQVSEKAGAEIWDKLSGVKFTLSSGEFYIDDYVRKIYFTPGQIQKVNELKPAPGAKQPMAVLRYDRIPAGKPFLPTWLVESCSKWSVTGERFASVRLPKGTLDMTQQIVMVTPKVVRAYTKGYDWDVWYFTPEFGPEQTRDLLFHIFNERKELKALKDADKLLKFATFMEQAGWYDEAEKELVRCVDNFPAERKEAQGRLDKLKQIRANLYVDGIKKAADVGQHEIAIDKLDVYDKQALQALVTDDTRLIAQDLKVKYDKSKTDIEQAIGHLKRLPGYTKEVKTWAKASAFIAGGVNHDTVDRLDTFLAFAQQFEKDRKDGRKPTQSAEEVLAMAVSGWLLSKQAADPDPVLALKLAHAREFILGALASDDPSERSSMHIQYKAEGTLPMDVLVRLVKMLPPPFAYEAKNLGTQTQTIKIEAPDAVAGSYLVKLPPDYHHQRSYPVMMVLPTNREKPEDHLAKFADEAAKNAYILVTPLGKRGAYQYSAAERALAIDTLRDLRRRFQVDSDRIFLFGWDEGGNMAFDVGLAHPDQFAGVMVMNGTITPFARRFYWPNARHVPFYVIEGDRNVANTKWLRDLFKDWNREPYAATYVEYKGRGTEWYSSEVANMMGWMHGKKRFYPRKELGRDNSTAVVGEEFHSTRPGDNRFYWLTTEGIASHCQADHRTAKWAGAFRPATFQANLSIGNEKDSTGAAKIWNQLNVRVTGLKQVTVWFTPTMMDFTKPLKLRVNSTEVESKRIVQPSAETMVEELYQTGDRQRLMVAKISLRL